LRLFNLLVFVAKDLN